MKFIQLITYFSNISRQENIVFIFRSQYQYQHQVTSKVFKPREILRGGTPHSLETSGLYYRDT
jgi:hypothetical protein